jgi:glycosyltransferase involved in cell wall biosynthesis
MAGMATIASCVVTYQRLDYTQRTIESILNTRTGPHHLTVVDNHSTDGTRAWLESVKEIDVLILNDRNLWPGAACNLGWFAGIEASDPQLLHRSDNDVEYLPGWCEHVREVFKAFPDLGQFGLLNLKEDFPDGQPLEPYGYDPQVNRHWPRLGGNCVVRRTLWDRGLRWKPGAWSPGGEDEDTWMSRQVQDEGFFIANAIPDIARNMAFGRFHDHPDYYRQTAAARGLVAETSV